MRNVLAGKRRYRHPTELAVRDSLPIRQFLTAPDAWISVLIFGLIGFLLIVIGRVLRG